MRRLLPLLALIAAVSIAAAPALAATTTHIRERGTGLGAYYSNVVFDAKGNVVPGSYVEAYVDASTAMRVGDEAWEARWACAAFAKFTVDEEGEWTEETWAEGCGPYDVLTINQKLSKGHVVASIPVVECVTWDDETDECLEVGLLGTFEVDVTLTGVGRLLNWHENRSGGTAGIDQYSYHGRGSQRAARPAGTFTFDGAPVIGTATWTGGVLFRTKAGWVAVSH